MGMFEPPPPPPHRIIMLFNCKEERKTAVCPLALTMAAPLNEGSVLPTHPLVQGCQTHFHWGPRQLCSCLQRARCNFRTI